LEREFVDRREAMGYVKVASIKTSNRRGSNQKSLKGKGVKSETEISMDASNGCGESGEGVNMETSK